jgi:hypothetical protein
MEPIWKTMANLPCLKKRPKKLCPKSRGMLARNVPSPQARRIPPKIPNQTRMLISKKKSQITEPLRMPRARWVPISFCRSSMVIRKELTSPIRITKVITSMTAMAAISRVPATTRGKAMVSSIVWMTPRVSPSASSSWSSLLKVNSSRVSPGSGRGYMLYPSCSRASCQRTALGPLA